jgi:ATP-dependent Clp protease ATP-binding subunit ClpA
VKVSSEVEIACSVAATEAANRGHELMTVEHLLYALLMDTETARVVAQAGGKVGCYSARPST